LRARDLDLSIARNSHTLLEDGMSLRSCVVPASLSLLGASFAALALGCSSDSGDAGVNLDVSRVASGGFHAPLDAVASPDGKTFYFSAVNDDGAPAIFSVASAPGSHATALVAGDPMTAPGALVLSCDGSTLYVAGGAAGGVYRLPTAGGSLMPMTVDGARRVDGLAVGPDCETLYMTGATSDDRPALFRMNSAGGTADVVYAGAPLIAPAGVFVDSRGVAWVMDQQAAGPVTSGALYAIPSDGSKANVVVGGLPMNGLVGGVSLTSDGKTAVISGSGADGRGKLTTVVLATGEQQTFLVPDMQAPGGVRTARNAPVLALVDSEGEAIYRADSR
jgi:hypothetical protein